MSDKGKKTQDFTHPVTEGQAKHENADEAGAASKAEHDIVAEEASHANAEAKAEAKHVPPDVISKKQRKRL